jgi:pyruvate dehydrogenase E2 component (dihydrolipoamide acetyltransferase)
VTDILMPALSPTMEEGALAKWLVKPGDKVKSGDIIAEIETDKATMEVEAVDEGVVEALLVDAGAQNVKVGATIARLSGGDAPAASAAPAPAASPSPEAKPAASEPAPAAKAAAGDLPPSPSVRRIAAENGLDLSGVTGTGREGRLTKADALAAVNPGRIFASPIARRLAGERGIELATLKGSGPAGRIIERDLEGVAATPAAARSAAAPAPQAGQPAPAHAPSLEDLGIPAGSYDLTPLDGMRRTVARRLTEAARDIPHFPLTLDLEIDELLKARTAINALLEKSGVKVSVNDMVIKASAVALMRNPDTNASFTPEGIARHHDADISMAVAIDGGLITPIIRKAQLKTLSQIAVEAKDLAERAKARKLKPEEFQGGTFSVSNLGMFGIRQFSSIINPPQGAILSVGAGEKRPVVRGDQLAVATIMTVTLTCDHRVVDGATGARWLQTFKTLIEQPAAMLA